MSPAKFMTGMIIKIIKAKKFCIKKVYKLNLYKVVLVVVHLIKFQNDWQWFYTYSHLVKPYTGLLLSFDNCYGCLCK